MRVRPAELLETAYDLDIPSSEWLAQLCRPIHAIHERAVGTWVFEFDRRTPELQLGQRFVSNPALAEVLDRSVAELPREYLDPFFNVPLRIGTTREVLAAHGVEFEGSPSARLFATIGYADTLGMAAADPIGLGISVGIGFPEVVRASPRQLQTWTQIAAHLAAAHRMRRKLALADAAGRAEAILSPSGKLEHRASAELSPELHAELVDAVERVEYARNRARDLEDALQLWRSLVAGEWSLADHFEGGGRRYYVAIRNPPEVAPNKALTRREAEVVAYLARGTKTQAVAYALGLDEVTVRGYLKTALAKLGLRSRAELIEVHALLEAQRDPSPTPGPSSPR